MANEYIIITDSGSDITPSVAAEWGVRVVPLSYTMDDGEPRPGDQVDLKEFYVALRNKAKATTSAANLEDFTKYFSAAANEGFDVLYLGFSSVEENKLHLCHHFTVDDLFFLKRGGRVSAATAVVGSMLAIKPLLHVDDEGHLISIGKARGRKGAIDGLVKAMEETVVSPETQTMFICHGDCEDEANALAETLKAKFNPVDVKVGCIGPVIGAHSGPGTIAVFFLGTKR